MKVTLWQQFSSNHSASFTIVGQFQSPEQAAEAATLIRDVVEQVGDYYRQRFPDPIDFYEWAEDIDIRSLSPVEDAIRKELKIRPRSWMYPPDWAYEGTPVRVYQNLVFVSSGGESWSPFHPIDSLIKKSGGKFYGNQEGYGYCTFTLVCQAKDKASAKHIQETLTLIEQKNNFEYHYIQIPDSLRFGGEIEVKEQRITFKNIGISATDRADSTDTAKILSALIPYLESQECSEIRYQFKQIS